MTGGIKRRRVAMEDRSKELDENQDLYIYIIPKNPSSNEPNVNSIFVLSSPFTKNKIEGAAFFWAQIVNCKKEDVQIIKLHMPKKQYEEIHIKNQSMTFCNKIKSLMLNHYKICLQKF